MTSRSRPAAGRPTPPVGPAGCGLLFAAIWLFFLLDPLLGGVGPPRRRLARLASGMVATVAFARVYMLRLWVRARRRPARSCRRARRAAAALA